MIPKAIPLRSEAMFALATRHTSATDQPVTESYERLEFFGDSVLGLVIAQYLYEHHPNWDQGMLSKAKSSVVQEAPLAEVAIKLGIPEYVQVSQSEEVTGGRNRASILADIVEALIGAIYLESGLEVARWFVLEQMHEYLMRISGGDVSPGDFKSKLQEYVQRTWRRTPVYRVIRESGTSHERTFVVQVIVEDDVLGEGAGRSKKEAEQSAASDALEVIDRAQRAREVIQERYI